MYTCEVCGWGGVCGSNVLPKAISECYEKVQVGISQMPNYIAPLAYSL